MKVEIDVEALVKWIARNVSTPEHRVNAFELLSHLAEEHRVDDALITKWSDQVTEEKQRLLAIGALLEKGTPQ